MKKFIILVREPENSTDKPQTQDLQANKIAWDNWFRKYSQSGNFSGGSGLVPGGKIIKGDGGNVINDISQHDNQTVVGYLLIKTETLYEAVEIAAELPVYALGGYTEVRELRVDD